MLWKRSGTGVRIPSCETILALFLSLGACSNDYSQFNFDTAPLEGGADDASSDGASTGGTQSGGTSGGGSGGVSAGSGGTGGSGRGGGGSGGAATGGAGGTGATDAAPDGPTDGAPGTDATSPLDSGLASCDVLYGGASMYVLCSEGPSSCTFAAMTAGTCSTVCSTFGGTCLEADNNDIEPCVVTSTFDTCATMRTTAICTCSRG